jgi:hypothetical protein
MPEIELDLYRSLKSSSIAKKREDRDDAFTKTGGEGSLHPKAGVDVTTYFDGGGVEWVRSVEERNDDGKSYVNDEEGISVTATLGIFGYAGWCYFLLPKTTSVPGGLDIKKTPTDKDPEHRSIRCIAPMTLSAFKGALDTLARAAIAKAVESGRSSLTHSG